MKANKMVIISWLNSLYEHWVFKFVFLTLGIWYAFPQPKRNSL